MIALVLAAMLLQTPAPKPPMTTPMTTTMTKPPSADGPRTIEKGEQSNVDEAKQVLVRTEAEWTKLWQQHSPDRPRPAVDFSKEMVVGVFMGSRPNAGFSTSVISTTAGNGALIVRYKETMPASGTVSAQILTFPYHLVAIPKADVKDVKFEKTQSTTPTQSPQSKTGHESTKKMTR